MSWLFSRVLVEAFSVANSLGGKPFVLLKSSDTHVSDSLTARTTDASTHSQSGAEILGNLTAGRGEELLTWFQEVSRVRTFQPHGQCSMKLNNTNSTQPEAAK